MSSDTWRGLQKEGVFLCKELCSVNSKGNKLPLRVRQGLREFENQDALGLIKIIKWRSHKTKQCLKSEDRRIWLVEMKKEEEITRKTDKYNFISTFYHRINICYVRHIT